MAKAKVGDMIRVINVSPNDVFNVGDTGIVQETLGDDIYVEFSEEGDDHFLWADEYEVISQSPPKDYAEPVTQADRISALCDEVKALLIRKNNDYGDSFAKQYEKYGLLSGLIRMDDKMRRLETLTGGHEAEVDESIDDTLRDLAGYALLTLVERGKAKEAE